MNRLYRHAIRLLSASEALLAQINARLDIYDQSDNEQAISMLHVEVDEAAFTAAWTEGRVMTLEQAINYALEAAGK